MHASNYKAALLKFGFFLSLSEIKGKAFPKRVPCESKPGILRQCLKLQHLTREKERRCVHVCRVQVVEKFWIYNFIGELVVKLHENVSSHCSVLSSSNDKIS